MELLLVGLGVLSLLFLFLIWWKLQFGGQDDGRQGIQEQLQLSRQEAGQSSRELREEVGKRIDSGQQGVLTAVSELGKGQLEQLSEVQKRINQGQQGFVTNLGEMGKAQLDQLSEVQKRLEQGNQNLVKTLGDLGKGQFDQLTVVQKQLKELTESNQAQIDRLREGVGEQLKELQKGNEEKLEKMRQTVDEKLQTTLEKRLGESFKLVSERLEAVQRGLGEMKGLADGVGDLKRVLTNVKARGTWGEVQLGAILEQLLTSEQYDANVKTKKGSNDLVEFAIKLPGAQEDPDTVVYLPIDSKFPQEDYLRLLEASEKADAEGVLESTKALVRSVKTSAKYISDKYVDPPHTTDFAIMFLPTEGLYAEVLRQPGLLEDLQQTCRVTVVGPTTLSALVNSLRLGFRTLAIEQRSAEVWQVLAAVKTEFRKFGDVMVKVKKQLKTVSNTIDDTTTRTRQMERKLKTVESLPTETSAPLLGLDDEEAETEEMDDE
jgi:DNA recombination protein RmuC